MARDFSPVTNFQNILDVNDTSGQGRANKTVAMALDLHRTLKGHMSRDERLYRLQFNKPALFADMRAITIPTARNAVLFIANALTTEMPACTMHPRSDEDKALENAENLSNFLESTWYFLQSGRKRSVVRDAVWHGLVRGAFIFRVLLDKDYLAKKPKLPVKPKLLDDSIIATLSADERANYLDLLDQYTIDKEAYDTSTASWDKKNKNQFPIRIQARDPIYVYWDNTEDPEWVVEVYPRKWYEVERMYGKRLKDKYQPGVDKVTGAMKDVWFCEVWTKDKYWYGLSSTREGNFKEIQAWKEHGYGFLPYVIQGAYSTPLNNIEDQYESIYAGHHSMLEYEYLLLNQLAEYIRKIALANIIAKVNDPAAVLNSVRNGSVIHILPEEEVGFLEPTGGTAQIIQTMLDTVQGYLTRFLLQPEVLQGRTRSRSGYGTQIQAQLAAQTLLPLTTGLSVAIQQVNEMILKMVELLPGKVAAWGPYNEFGEAYATKEMVGGFYRNDVEIEIKLPSEEAQVSQTYVGLVKEGIVSKLYARRKIGIKNPRKEARQILVEKALSQPFVEQALAFDMVLEMGIKLPDQIQSAIDAMAKGGQAPSPGGGVPAGPQGNPAVQAGPGQGNQPGPGSPQEMAMMQAQAGNQNPAAAMAQGQYR